MMAILPWLKEQQRMSWQHHFILRHKQKANKEIHVYVCTCQAAAAQAAGWWCTFPFPHLFRGNQSVHKIHAATWYALYTQRSTICQMVFLFFSVICWTTTQLGSLSCTIFEYPFYRWNWVIRRRKGEWKVHCINKQHQNSFSLSSITLSSTNIHHQHQPADRKAVPTSAAQEVYSTSLTQRATCCRRYVYACNHQHE